MGYVKDKKNPYHSPFSFHFAFSITYTAQYSQDYSPRATLHPPPGSGSSRFPRHAERQRSSKCTQPHSHMCCLSFSRLLSFAPFFFSVALFSFHESTMAAQQKKLKKGVERLVWCIDNITNINRSLLEDRIISSYDIDDVRLSLANRDIFRHQIALYCSSNELVNDIYMHFPNE